MQNFLEWLKYLIIIVAAYGAFWSYKMITTLEVEVQQLVEINQNLSIQIEQQCEMRGYVKPDVDNP